MAILAAFFPPRRTLRATLTGAFASIAIALVAFSARADNTLEEANRLLRAGQHADALRQVDRYLASRPKDAQGRFLRGIILTGMNRQKEAIAVFERLTQDYPDLPEPHNNLAVIYAQQQQYEKAKEHLEKAIRTHPAYATAHENLGDIYSRLASQAYGKALSIDATNTSAQTKLAMIDSLVGTGTPKVGAGGTATAAASAPATPPAAAPAASPRPAPAPAAAPSPPVTPPTPVVVATNTPAPAPVTRSPEPAAAPPAPAPAAELPRPAAAPAAPRGEGEVVAAVDAWLAAWSKKDVKGYLAHYASNFQVPGGQSRRDWETERSQRISRPASISVTRDNLSVRMDGEDKATVRFRQTYRAPGFNATTMKTLVMVRQGGRWLIQQERTG